MIRASRKRSLEHIMMVFRSLIQILMQAAKMDLADTQELFQSHAARSPERDNEVPPARVVVDVAALTHRGKVRQNNDVTRSDSLSPGSCSFDPKTHLRCCEQDVHLGFQAKFLRVLHV